MTFLSLSKSRDIFVEFWCQLTPLLIEIILALVTTTPAQKLFGRLYRSDWSRLPRIRKRFFSAD